MADRKTRDAVIRNLEVIGEACNNVAKNHPALLRGTRRCRGVLLREMEIAKILLPRHCERSVAIHATVVHDHGSPRFARDDETGMFVISDSLTKCTMRYRMRYFTVDQAIVWQTIQQDLPNLRNQILAFA